jgi:membrane protein implicated in regulation of membrane protease activity
VRSTRLEIGILVGALVILGGGAFIVFAAVRDARFGLVDIAIGVAILLGLFTLSVLAMWPWRGNRDR